MRARLATILCAVVLSLALSSYGRAAELKIGLSQFPSSFNPHFDAAVAKSYALQMTQRPITAYDQAWELVCLLCTEVPTLENGQAKLETLTDGGQGIAVTYRLQPEATWGDGTPVTSADMLFTWEAGRHPKSGFGDFEIFRRILAIDVIDDKTFAVHVDRVDFLYSAAPFDLLPAHLERPIFEADPAAYRNRSTYETDPANPGLAFGPYRLIEVVAGSRIVLEPNPTWWGKPPAFDRITLLVIENTAALEANLLSGAIDMISGELGVTIDQALAFEKRHGNRYNIIYKPGLIYEHVDLNLDNPILADNRVRRALIHGLNREALSQTLFGGKQPVAQTSVSPLDWVYDPDVPSYGFDPARAKVLLEEAGWIPGPDGVRHNASGERLTLELMTTAGNRSRELVSQVLQSQWRDLGIDARIRNEPARVFFGETVGKRKFPGGAMFAWVSSPEIVPRTTLYSDQIPTAENNWAGQNYTSFANAEMDTVIDAIELELDREKRKTLWSRLQRIYAEELPVIPLYWRANSFILPKWLKGVRPTGHLNSTTLWVEDWYAEGR
ncbi:MAG: peptide ABC transporter substrate-binding protein [Alphaproteobacteria bacterium]